MEIQAKTHTQEMQIGNVCFFSRQTCSDTLLFELCSWDGISWVELEFTTGKGGSDFSLLLCAWMNYFALYVSFCTYMILSKVGF